MDIKPEKLLYYNKMMFNHCEKPEDKNKREYASFTYQYAEEWAEQMEQDIIKDKPDNLVKYFQENAEEKTMKLKTVNEGLTGFQHDIATQLLINVWKYGYELYIGLIKNKIEKEYHLTEQQQEDYDKYLLSTEGLNYENIQ